MDVSNTQEKLEQITRETTSTMNREISNLKAKISEITKASLEDIRQLT